MLERSSRSSARRPLIPQFLTQSLRRGSRPFRASCRLYAVQQDLFAQARMQYARACSVSPIVVFGGTSGLRSCLSQHCPLSKR